VRCDEYVLSEDTTRLLAEKDLAEYKRMYPEQTNWRIVRHDR
jgi:hypothetical protein